jgi:hypothetical protein
MWGRGRAESANPELHRAKHVLGSGSCACARPETTAAETGYMGLAAAVQLQAFSVFFSESRPRSRDERQSRPTCRGPGGIRFVGDRSFRERRNWQIEFRNIFNFFCNKISFMVT